MAKYPRLIKENQKIRHPITVKPAPTVNFSYENSYSTDRLRDAYHQATRGSRAETKVACRFNLTCEDNLEKLHDSLMKVALLAKYDADGVYVPGDYKQRIIHEPKERVLNIPKLLDKIVQLATHEALQSLFLSTYIKTSFACQTSKGHIRAAIGVMHFLRLAKEKWGNNVYIVRIDAKKYFYSIDRDILKRILVKRFKHIKAKYPSVRPDLLRLYNLLCKIIDSSPEGKTGIPLGNVTSQDFANIYLTELDNYVVRYLKAKYYVRYMDDIIIVVRDKTEAQRILELCVNFMRGRLNLEVNGKTQVFSIKQGVNAFGYKIKVEYMLVRTESKRRMIRRGKSFVLQLAKAHEIVVDPFFLEIEVDRIREKCRQSFAAWIGFSRWASSYNLVKSVADRFDDLLIVIEGRYPYGMIGNIKQLKHRCIIQVEAPAA